MRTLLSTHGRHNYRLHRMSGGKLTPLQWLNSLYKQHKPMIKPTKDHILIERTESLKQIGSIHLPDVAITMKATIYGVTRNGEDIQLQLVEIDANFKNLDHAWGVAGFYTGDIGGPPYDAFLLCPREGGMLFKTPGECIAIARRQEEESATLTLDTVFIAAENCLTMWEHAYTNNGVASPEWFERRIVEAQAALALLRKFKAGCFAPPPRDRKGRR